MNIGIYKITCLLDGLVYIGYSTNLKSRESNYKFIKTNNQTQTKLKEHILKYGWINFKFDIIEHCSKDSLKEREKFYIKIYDSYINGLNSNSGGGGPMFHNDQTKLKLKNARLGKKDSEKTKNIKSKLKLGHKYNLGRKQTIETKQKISKARKGWKPSIERGIIIGSKNKGRVLSQEHKDKISQANKNKPKPEGFKGRISPNKGKKHILSKEQKLGMLNSHGVKINQYDLEDNLIKEWQTISEITRELGIKSSSISQCASGKIEKSHGFKWKYKNESTK